MKFIRLKSLLYDLTGLSAIGLIATTIGKISYSPIHHYWPFALGATLIFGTLSWRQDRHH